MSRSILLLAAVCAACGGPRATPIPISPSPLPAPVTWTLTGRVVNTTTQSAIANAHLAPYNVMTAGDGNFSATGSGIRTTDRVTVEADGFVSRQTTITSSTTAPTLDLFPSSTLDFYRQLVRNGFESPGFLQPLRRWTSAPQFYISQDGQLSPEDIRRIDVGILAAIAQMTPFGVAGITVGPSRPDQIGWVTISFINDTSSTGCGFSTVGDNPGHVTLNRKSICSSFCPGAQMIPGTVAHEVGHTLGFWHIADGLMKTGVVASRCVEPITFTAAERQAAAIAYTRPAGNSDPDVDPTGQAFLGPARYVRD